MHDDWAVFPLANVSLGVINSPAKDLLNQYAELAAPWWGRHCGFTRHIEPAADILPGVRKGVPLLDTSMEIRRSKSHLSLNQQDTSERFYSRSSYEYHAKGSLSVIDLARSRERKTT